MSKKPILTTESGAAVTDNQNSQTAGPSGPALLQDHHLIEKLARFNRERIPERVVHAVGTGAYGYLEVTSSEVPKWTKMRIFETVGKRTDMFIRFSTVASSRGGPDVARDPRGFAMKYYTEDGNWDLVGNNTPVFFIRDGIKFPDFIHSQKPDPFTNRQEPDNVWDFFSHSPEATHQFTMALRRPRHPGVVPPHGRVQLAHLPVGQHQGRACSGSSSTQDGPRHPDLLLRGGRHFIGGQDQHHCHKDLYHIERGDFPSWTVKVQVMPEAEAATYRIDPFDLTKVWNYRDYPLIPIAKLVLNRLPANYFAETEQAVFDPAHFVPGIGPSPDRMLQSAPLRLRGRASLPRGHNHTALPVNEPKGVAGGAKNYGRDGVMPIGAPSGRAKNDEPDSFDGPVQTNEKPHKGLPATGMSGHCPQGPREVDDFMQIRRPLSSEAEGRAAASGGRHRREPRAGEPRGHHRTVRRSLHQSRRRVRRRIAGEGIAARRTPPAGTAR